MSSWKENLEKDIDKLFIELKKAPKDLLKTLKFFGIIIVFGPIVMLLLATDDVLKRRIPWSFILFVFFIGLLIWY